MTDPSRRLEPVVRIAPAKVNLTLAVLGLRPDGFHDLHSIMVPVDHADRLSVSVAPPGGTDTLHVTGFDPGALADNLVLRAVAAARRAALPEWGRREPPRRSPPAWRSASPSPRVSPGARRTPPRPPTPRWRPGA